MCKISFEKSLRSRCAAPSRATKSGSAYTSETAIPILTRLTVWMDTPCRSIILKNQDDRGSQHQVIALSLGSLRPRREAPGIEVRSQGVKRLELGVRSTEYFPFLGWDRSAPS